MKLKLFGVFCLLSIHVFAQQTIKLLDKSSKEPIPFAHIINTTQPNLKALFTNLDGKVDIPESWKQEDEVFISCVGYEEYTTSLPLNSPILLIPSNKFLEEVVFVAGENPAHQYVRKAIEQRENNDPKGFSNFQETAYTKFILTADSSDLTIELDSGEIDSVAFRATNFLRKRHFFILESLVKKTKTPKGEKEEVLANRVSGLQSPQFFLISSQIQSVSIYENQYTILEKEYVNPISPNTFKRYFFRLEDSIQGEEALLYQISFKPKPKVEFDGLIGQIIVDKNGNVHSFSAQTPDSTGTKVNIDIGFQNYFGKWIPEEVQSEVVFTNSSVNGAPLKGKLRASFLDRTTETEVLKRSHIGLQFNTEQAAKDSIYWEKIRPVELTEQELNTYGFMDSVGKANSFDKRLAMLTSLADGRIPIYKSLSLNVNDVLGYTRFAGFLVGAGLNWEPFQNRLGFYGKAKYGLRDKRLRYDLGAELVLSKSFNWKLNPFIQSEDFLFGGIIGRNPKPISLIDNTSLDWFQDYILLNQQYGVRSSITPSKFFDIEWNFGHFYSDERSDLADSISISGANTMGGKIIFHSNRLLAYMNTRLRTIQKANTVISLCYQNTQVNNRDNPQIRLEGDHDFNRTFSKIEIDWNIQYAQTAGTEIAEPFTSRPIFNPTNIAKYWMIEQGWNSINWIGFYDQFIDLGIEYTSKRFLWRKSLSEPQIGISTRIGYGILPIRNKLSNLPVGDEKAAEIGIKIRGLYKNSLFGVINQTGNLGFYLGILNSEKVLNNWIDNKVTFTYAVRFNIGI